MLVDGDGPLEVLVTTPPSSQALEMYELQAGEGPCLDAFVAARAVHVAGADRMLARWPAFAPQLAQAGVRSVYACPMCWQGTAIGALNVFLADEAGLPFELRTIVQAFADIATIAVIQAAAPAMPDLEHTTRRALMARTIVEQAKGVLAFQHGIDIDSAFMLLQTAALNAGLPLQEIAQRIVTAAVRDHR
jgi:antitoxin component of RelBE/YafQ-DinJ toxin-antitoxin module